MWLNSEIKFDPKIYKTTTVYVNIIVSDFVSLIVPIPNVEMYIPENQLVGQSLTLECNGTVVRGITSRVDIVWSSNGVELRRIMGATPNSTSDNSEVYEDAYDIPLLSTSDDGRVIECEIIIMTTPSIIVAAKSITLDVTSKWCRLYY